MSEELCSAPKVIYFLMEKKKILNPNFSTFLVSYFGHIEIFLKKRPLFTESFTYSKNTTKRQNNFLSIFKNKFDE